MTTTEAVKAATEEAAEAKAPRILADGDVYAVLVNGQFFGSFDEDGHAWVYNIPTHFSHGQAVEIASKITRAKIVRVPPEDNGKLNFWINKDVDGPFGGYDERTLHVGSHVRCRYDNVPGWFKAAMLKASPEGSSVTTWDDESYDDGLIALEIFLDESGISSQHWLDHDGWVGEGENSVFVSEPYHLDQEDIQQIIEACKKFGFTFEISGKSEHYPSSTVRIRISPIEKLSYVRPVRAMTPEQKAWEDQRTFVFYRLVRTMAADYVEHVLHVVERSWCFGEVPVLNFIKGCLVTARAYANFPDEDSKAILDGYRESAGKKYREALRAKFDSPTVMVLNALQYLLAPNSRYLCCGIKNICADAVQRWMERHGKCDFDDGMKPYREELAWQEAHSKSEWDEYKKNWAHDYKETENAENAESKKG